MFYKLFMPFFLTQLLCVQCFTVFADSSAQQFPSDFYVLSQSSKYSLKTNSQANLEVNSPASSKSNFQQEILTALPNSQKDTQTIKKGYQKNTQKDSLTGSQIDIKNQSDFSKNSLVSSKESQTEKESSFSNVKVLQTFFSTHSALQIHNKAVEFLQKDEPILAILLLKKNFYRNLFFPSYFALLKINESAFIAKALVLFGFFLLSLLLIMCFLIYLKSKQSFYLKFYISTLCLYAAVLLLSADFLYERQVSSLTAINLKTLPFKSAQTTSPIQAGEELVILDYQFLWLYVKKPDQTKGWIKVGNLFNLF